MDKEYNGLLQGLITKLFLNEELKGTQYIKLLLTPNNTPIKICSGNSDVISFSLPYPTFLDVANILNVPLTEVKSDIEKVLSTLKWDKRMWQDIMDYFGRLIEIDIYDERFCGDLDYFTWKVDAESFIDYIADSLYHIHHGIMSKRKNGIVRLYDSKKNKYLDNLTEEDFNNFED